MATRKLFSLTLLAASALAISTPVFAETKTTLVQYHDIDLSSVTGQKLLKARVAKAAKQVCTSKRAVEFINQKSCETTAMARALPQVERTIALYKTQQGIASRDVGAMVGN